MKFGVKYPFTWDLLICIGIGIPDYRILCNRLFKYINAKCKSDKYISPSII